MKRLNLGSGRFKLDGWINADIAFETRPDLVADGTRLPFPDSVFDLIYMGHSLEHMYPWQAALCEANRVLRIGGKLWVVVPDILRCQPGSYIMGGAIWGDIKASERHVTVWTESLLIAVVKEFGFELDSTGIPPWAAAPNVTWQCGAEFRKVKDCYPCRTLVAAIRSSNR